MEVHNGKKFFEDHSSEKFYVLSNEDNYSGSFKIEEWMDICPFISYDINNGIQLYDHQDVIFNLSKMKYIHTIELWFDRPTYVHKKK